MKTKSVIVTGAAMGLGLAAAKELASKGTNLSLVDFNEQALLKAKEEIQKAQSGVHDHVCLGAHQYA